MPPRLPTMHLHKVLSVFTKGRHRYFSLAVLSFLIAGLITLASGCSSQMDSGIGTTKSARPPVPVTVAMTVMKSVPVELLSVGQVEPSSTVTIRSQVSGVIAGVHVREGDEVRKGDLLFTLDQRPFEALLAKAEADLAQDLVAYEKARNDTERNIRLLASGFISQEDATAVRTQADALQAAVASARASVENARLQHGYCTIRAPQGGRTGEIRVHPGTVVKANDAPDLVTINTLQPVLVAFSIPERNLPILRKQFETGRLEVKASPPGDTLPPEKGRVSFLDNAVDPATGTIRLKGAFANHNGRLWPGQFVEVKVVLAMLDNAIVVPAAAVQTGQQGTYVFVVGPDTTTEVRPVTVRMTSGNEAVIETGLDAEETVVTEGQQRLFPGAKAQVRQSANADQPRQS